MPTQLNERVQRALRKAKQVIARLSEFDIEEVSLVDRPANKRPFIVRKREEQMPSKKAVTVLKGLATPMETLATVVTKLEDGANAEQLSALQDKAKALAGELRDLVPDAEGAAPESDKLLTETATTALEQLTEIAEKLKGESLTDEDMAAAQKGIATIAAALDNLGEKVAAAAPEPAAPAAGDPPAAEPTADPPAAEPTPDPPAAAPPAADPPAAEPAADPPAGDPPATEPSASVEAMKPEEVVEVSEELAKLADGIATENMTQEAAVELQKRFDDTFLRGGVTIDTGDMAMLEKVVGMISKVLGGDKSDIAKRAEVFKAAFKDVAVDLRDIAKSVKGAETVAVSVFKQALGLQMTVAHLAKNLDPAQPAGAVVPQADIDAKIASQVDAKLTSLVDEKVTPLAKRVADLEATNKVLTEENVSLRSEIEKADSTPAAPRGSSPEPGAEPGSDSGSLFPQNYNNHIDN